MGRCIEVHTVERVERIYVVEFHGADLDSQTLKDAAEEQVRCGEVHKFREVNAEIEDVQSVKEVA